MKSHIHKIALNILHILDNSFHLELYKKAVRVKDKWYESNNINFIRRFVHPKIAKIKFMIFPNTAERLRLHLGCGNRRIEGSLNIDWRKTNATDMVCDIKKLPFQNNSIEKIESYHVIEHLSRHDVLKALKEWNRVLQSGGTLNIECPDFDELVRLYLKGDEKALDGIFALQRFEGDYHLFGYNYKRLKRVLENSGFTDIKSRTAQDYHTSEWPCIRVESSKI